MNDPATGASPGRGILRTFLWPILAVAVLTSLTAVWVLASQEPVYVSSGSVLVGPDRQDGTPILPEMGTEREIAMSAEVADRAAVSLAVPPTAASRNLEVTVPVDAQVVDLSYSASTPEAARAGAEAFTQAYVEYRNLNLERPLVRVISAPGLPVRPTRLNYAVAATIALLAGLGLGFAAALLWDRLRDRLRGCADAEHVTGAEILGSVPARARVDAPLEHRPDGFGHLAARLSNVLGYRRRNVTLMITSPRRGAGATTVATHLAVALADIGRDVVLVSGNPRRPDLHRMLGLERAPGVAEVLGGECSLVSAVQLTSRPNLRVLTAGSSAGRSELDVDEYLAIIRRLASEAIVVIDAAPALELPDTMLVGNACDLTILVVDARGSGRKDAALAADTLRGLPGSLVGVVANRPRSSRRIETRPAAGDVRPPGADPNVVPAEPGKWTVNSHGSRQNAS
jgi:polysaccharide biosynthesis transport protein